MITEYGGVKFCSGINIITGDLCFLDDLRNNEVRRYCEDAFFDDYEDRSIYVSKIGFTIDKFKDYVLFVMLDVGSIPAIARYFLVRIFLYVMRDGYQVFIATEDRKLMQSIESHKELDEPLLYVHISETGEAKTFLTLHDMDKSEK